MTAHDAPSPEEQLVAAREGVLLLAPPLVDLEPLRVRGKDRVTWLNGMVTSDVAKLPVGGAQYGLHVGKTGKIAAELWIAREEGELVVAVPRGQADDLQASLDRFLIMEQCEIVARDPDAAFALAIGPGSTAIVAEAEAAGLRGAIGARRGGAPVAMLFGESALLSSFAAARRHVATGPGWERVRVELGIGRLGVDFDHTAYPQEAALEADAVSFSKGCYLGQEAVFMMQERGHPPRRLVKLSVDGDAAPGAPVTVDGAVVGTATTVVAGTALGTIKWKHAKPGVVADVGGHAARVVAAG